MIWDNATILIFIWDASWVISAMSLVILAVLVVCRYFHDIRMAAYMSRYNELSRLLFIHMANPLSKPDKVFVKNKWDLEILSKLIQKILLSFSGASKRSIHSFVSELNLEDWICNRVQFGNSREKMAAIQLLGYLDKNKKNERLLVNVLNNEKSIRLRFMAAESLSRLGDVKNLTKIVNVLKREDYISSLLLFDIFRSFGVEAEDKLIQLLKNKTNACNVKIAAIKALGHISTLKSQSAVIKNCRNTNDDVCVAAYCALARIALPIPNKVISEGGGASILASSYGCCKLCFVCRAVSCR